MQIKFNGARLTTSGAPVRNVEWNSVANLYLGQVWDVTLNREDKWTSGLWKKSGKCVNGSRGDLQLITPNSQQQDEKFIELIDTADNNNPNTEARDKAELFLEKSSMVDDKGGFIYNESNQSVIDWFNKYRG